jgi:hypothetical protein
MENVDARYHVWSGMLPLRGQQKSARGPLPAMLEIARVRCQWLRRACGSIRIVLCVCVVLRQDNRV